ncbi:hypothetical protein PQE74_gp144 [Bacillus phage vB_BanS_Chewbecca]|uniref:Uncharacterized protein n=1 Tax=Bacillus phage vB_BanS_Chewbecca TaxID=2894786 RepID=A0AAE8YP83_9CAUD|nr:hypothetical protein PQE74_gp144 [Bacillus phage vB_BanS_Chewbecca]UGO46227.1 hypothetical protein CHEWBECCA_144 [Bacillus phage vB_BanS_Chewbecca]
MTKFEPTLNLSLNLAERKKQLRDELRKTVTELVSTTLKVSINDLLKEAKVEGVHSVNWDFHPESDDEGGTDWWIEYVSVVFEDDDLEVDLEEVTFQKESWRKDGTFWEANLYEELRETISEYRNDLYNYDITEIELV